jgi:hypothetical protein
MPRRSVRYFALSKQRDFEILGMRDLTIADPTDVLWRIAQNSG